MEREDGFPEWTELGQQGGLDPLGMQRPIEIIYQSLVPGISTITLRFRYYSFFCWMLETYAHKTGDTNPDKFRKFQRRCEALFALISAQGGQELGVTGIEWADRQVSLHRGDAGGIIDFSDGADQNTNGERYLKNKAGAFGAIYSTQMRDMGLVLFGNGENPNPICSTRALPLSKAFGDVLGPLSSHFLQAVDQGSVSVATLEQLDRVKPSEISANSEEYRELTNVLLGRSPEPQINDLRRRDTIAMLLNLTKSLGRRPRAEDAKWTWFDAVVESGDQAQRSDVPGLWALYQMCDLLRLAYEHILAGALSILEAAPSRQLPLNGLVDDLLDAIDLPMDLDWRDFTDTIGAGAEEVTVRQLYQDMADAWAEREEHHLMSAVRMIVVISQRVGPLTALLAVVLPSSDYFQSLRSELDFLAKINDTDARAALTRLIKERIIKRHLWVASRKFRNQRAYTYLMEPADGTVRFRDHFSISPSSPRLDQALNFLSDLRLINAKGLTELGDAELAAA